MLLPQLKVYAKHLDELKYVVSLRDRLDFEANKTFEDDDYFQTSWFADYWKRVFRSQLNLVAKFNENEIQGTNAIDVCCGQGYLGEAISHLRGVKITLVDLSMLQLQGLAKRIQMNPHASWSMCQSDATVLPFRTGSFDLVVGNSFLHHIADVPAALSELHRIQRQGGITILFHEPGVSAPFWQSFPISAIRKREGAPRYFVDLWLFDRAGIKRLLLESGWKEVHVIGTGILSGFFLNWYLLLMLKLGVKRRAVVYPAYLLRVFLNQLERRTIGSLESIEFPSLMVIAR